MKRLESNMTGVIKRINKAGHKMMDWGVKSQAAGVANMTSGVAAMAPIALATKQAVDLEAAVADIAKVLPNTVNVGSREFNRLEKGAQTVGYALGRSSEDAAGLMASLAAGGVAEKALTKTALLAGKIGVAFDVSGLQAGQSFQAIKNAMQLTDDGVMKVMNANNALANSFGSTVDASARLLQFMQDTGASVAASLHTSGSDIQALENSFMTIGIGSDEATTSIERLSKAILINKKLSATFNHTGGGSKGILAIFEQAKKSGNAVQWLLGHGVGQYSTKIGAVVNAMDSDKGFKRQLAFVNDDKNVTGSVDQEFATKASTKKFQLAQLKVGALNLATTLGSTLIPALTSLMKAAKPMLDTFSKWAQANPKVTGTILKVYAASAALKIGIGALQFGFGGYIKILGNIATNGSRAIQVIKGLPKAFSAVSTTFSVVGKFLMANPWMIVIVAIATAAFLIIKYWKPISKFFIKLWDWVKGAFSAAWKWIKRMFLNYTPYGLVIKHWDVISKFFVGLWDKIRGYFVAAWEWIKKMFLNYTPYGLVIKNWSKIVGAFSTIWEKVKQSFQKFIGWFVDKWEWLNKHVFEPIGKVLGFGDKNINVNQTVSGSGMPKLLPVRAGSNDQFHFAPVINVQGSVDGNTANKLSAQMRRDFEKQMQDYQHNKQRRAFN